MKRLLYTTRRSIALSQFVAGVGVRNPEYYSKPESDVQEVGIEGDYPQIAEDYARLGVKVVIGPAFSPDDEQSEGDDSEIERTPDGQPDHPSENGGVFASIEADERKLLIAELKSKGIKYARNASIDQLRALAQQENPVNG